MPYIIRGLWRYAEVDDFENGCIGPSQASHISLIFEAPTVDATIQKARDFVGVNEAAVERNACDEDGRIDLCRTENDNGNELTPDEITQWKAGNLRAWYCVYTGRLEKLETVRA